ncbi:MAG: SPFH domain-containing protein [Acidobacteria bacterium]|nr:SPFH domain-containing protein [Acidobacteriota bacterium]
MASFLLVLAAGTLAFFFLLIFLFGLVIIRENQVGVVIKRFSWSGKKLPEGRVIALEEEPGYQARTLGPGFHLWYFPVMYKIEKYPITVIAPGKIGLVIANDGNPPPVNRVLCEAVECDNFQNAEKFLRHGGQKGRQSAVLTAGYYRINPVLFKVVPDVPITKIDSNKIGIITVLDGAPMPVGQMAAQVIAGGESFQNPDAFIRNGGCRGLQEQIMLAGSYNINPWFSEIEEADLVEVPIGYVGVVVSFVGEDFKDISGEQFTHGNIVRKGGKGVWDEPLYPGKHALNTRIMKVELVPTTNIVLNWASTRTESHKLDEKLSTISVRSKDGFTFNLDVSQIINIGATKAPWVISRVGSVRNLVNQVLEPIIGNYFRNGAQNYTVLDFLSNRSERQTEARTHITDAIREYDVQSVDTLIGDIVPPEQLMLTLTTRKIAEEQQKTFQTEEQTQRTRQELERQKALADKQKEIVNSEQDVRIAEMRAKSAVEQAQGESLVTSRRAEGEAIAKRRVGEAEAEVVSIKGRNEAEAIRAIGQAKADAYKLGVEAMGGNFSLLQIFTILAEKGIRLTPDVMVSGGSNGGNASEAMLAMLLREAMKK